MLHLVEVIAVLDELTPTSPVTLASVHVTAVLARTANPAADPSPPEAWAGTADTPPSVAKKRRPRTRTLKSVRPTAFIPPSPIGAIPTAGSHATAEIFPLRPTLDQRAEQSQQKSQRTESG